MDSPRRITVNSEVFRAQANIFNAIRAVSAITIRLSLLLALTVIGVYSKVTFLVKNTNIHDISRVKQTGAYFLLNDLYHLKAEMKVKT